MANNTEVTTNTRKTSKYEAYQVYTKTDIHSNKIGEEEEKQELTADDDLSERDDEYENNDITFRMDKTILEEHPEIYPNEDDSTTQIQSQTVENLKPESEDNQHRGHSHEHDSEKNAPPPPPLFKSTRLNGYLRITFLASLCFVSAYESDFEHVITLLIFSENLDTGETVANTTYGAFQDNVTKIDGLAFKGGTPPIIVKADPMGRNYAMVTSGLSASLTMIIVALFFVDAILPMSKGCRIALRKVCAHFLTQRLLSIFSDSLFHTLFCCLYNFATHTNYLPIRYRHLHQKV